jgi:hypothetical protein
MKLAVPDEETQESGSIAQSASSSNNPDLGLPSWIDELAVKLARVPTPCIQGSRLYDLHGLQRLVEGSAAGLLSMNHDLQI